MTDTLSPLPISLGQPRTIPGNAATNSQSPPVLSSNMRNCHLTIDTQSPVNINGSFEFDRIIKSGSVQKRRRKMKSSWRTTQIVLRPNLLSIYRDAGESKLRHKIILSDVTAIARQKDPKGKVQHIFGIFSPSRNFHFSASSDAEAQEWVEQIRREARIDEDEEEMSLASPGGARSTYSGFERQRHDYQYAAAHRPTDYSSSDAEGFNRQQPVRNQPASETYGARRPSVTMDYSGPDQASFSDFSDSGPAGLMSSLSLSQPEPQVKMVRSDNQPAETIYESPYMTQRQITHPDAAEIDSLRRLQEAERRVRSGWMYLLKTTSGMRQWKKLWILLRPKSLTMYKSDGEYKALKIIPFEKIIDAVEIDAISNSKRFCMQIITEDKNYRLCAPDEDSWAQWLGSFKSLIAKRKDKAQA